MNSCALLCECSLDDPDAALTVVDSKKFDEAALVARTGVCPCIMQYMLAAAAPYVALRVLQVRRRFEAAASRASSITRSHGVLTICVAIPDVASGKDIVGKLHIVELASGVRAGALLQCVYLV